MINPTVLASDGRRMSKSLGTGVDPLDLIARHGADATRYGLLKMSSTQDVRFAEGAIEEGRGLCNKLWNAARMILLYVDAEAEPAPARAEPVDAWILGQLADAVAEVTAAIDAYDFAAAVKALYRFIWNDVCDWYLEAAKARLYGDDAAAKRDVSQTLLYVLRSTLRLAHPVLPHVTERIWGELGEEVVLARSSWPDPSQAKRDPAAEQAVEQAFDFIVKLRQLRAAGQMSPRAPLAVQGWPLAEVVPADRDARRREHRAARRWRGVARRRRDPRRRRARHRAGARGSRERAAALRAGAREGRGRDRAGRVASSPTRASSSAHRRIWCRRSATSWSASSARRRSCASASPPSARDRERLPGVAGRVRDAARARADLGAARGARESAGATRRDSRRGHERQVLDRALRRGGADRIRACARAPTSRRT